MMVFRLKGKVNERRRCLAWLDGRHVAIGVAVSLGLGSPAHGQALRVSTASPSYNPWIAAGLTYAPIAFAAAPGAIHSDPVYPGLQTFGLAVAVNPLPGMGQVYAGEPLRGFGILAGGATMLGATFVANLALNRRGRLSSTDPAPGFDPIPYLNIGFFAVSGLYSLWAAYDAYQIAARKNAESQALDLNPAESTP